MNSSDTFEFARRIFRIRSDLRSKLLTGRSLQNHLVHAPCPVTGEIHRYIGKSILFESLYDEQPVFKKLWKFFRQHLDPGKQSVDPDPEPTVIASPYTNLDARHA